MKFRTSSILLILVFLLCLVFKPDKHLDLFRYYEVAHSWGSMDYKQVVSLSIYEHGDFLYFLILKIFVDLGIPLQFVTAIFVTLFYKGGLLILEDNYKNGIYSQKSKQIAEKAIFLTVPIHLIISIARMTCSFSFAFLAIHMHKNNKHLIAILLVALAVCAHTGTTLFVGLYLLIELFLHLLGRFICFNSKKLALFMIIGGCLIVYSFSFLGEFLGKIPFFVNHSYYLEFINEIRIASYRENGFITFFAMTTYIVLNALYSYKSNLDENSLYCTCISCLVPAFYFLGNLFSMRACMFSIPFFSVCLMGAYSSSRNKAVYEIITLFTSMVFVLVLLAFHRLYF